MRGTTRPSDSVRAERSDAPGRVPARHLQHGEWFGSLRVEGVEFRDARRRRCVHLRCTCGAPHVATVYHLLSGMVTRCPACRKAGRRVGK